MGFIGFGHFVGLLSCILELSFNMTSGAELNKGGVNVDEGFKKEGCGYERKWSWVGRELGMRMGVLGV